MTKRISYRYRVILFSLIMSCSTAMIVSAIIIYLHGASHTAFIKAFVRLFGSDPTLEKYSETCPNFEN